MINDQLTREERIRLECIAQANQTIMVAGIHQHGEPADRVISIAMQYERFLTNADAERAGIRDLHTAPPKSNGPA